MNNQFIEKEVNVLIFFKNDENKINIDNLFYIENVKIKSVSDYDDDVLVLEKIKNINPIGDNFFVPRTGYEFHFRVNRFDDVDYASSYGCYFIVSFSNDENKLKNILIDHLIYDNNKRLKFLKEEMKQISDETNDLTILKNKFK